MDKNECNLPSHLEWFRAHGLNKKRDSLRNIINEIDFELNKIRTDKMRQSDTKIIIKILGYLKGFLQIYVSEFGLETYLDYYVDDISYFADEMLKRIKKIIKRK
jgi:hypothetical protein